MRERLKSTTGLIQSELVALNTRNEDKRTPEPWNDDDRLEFKHVIDPKHENLLQCAAKGEFHEVAKANPNLILKKGYFQEEWCGGRTWKNISPFQYVLWAGDMEMAHYFLSKLSSEDKPEALMQLKDLRDTGTEHGRPLCAVYRLLEAYKALCKHAGSKDSLKFWRAVGQAQFSSVVNLLQYFANSAEFDSWTDFSLPPGRWLSYGLYDTALDLSSTSLLLRGYFLNKDLDKNGRLELQSRCNFSPANDQANAERDANAVERYYHAREYDLDCLVKQLEQEADKELEKERETVAEQSSSSCLVM